MEEDEDKYYCPICLESFSKTNPQKQPRIFRCCGAKSYCLKCLLDIYKKNNNNIRCPICRKNTRIQPNNLDINHKLFCLYCPTCKKEASKEELTYDLDNLKIACSKCKPSWMKLSEIIQSLVDCQNMNSSTPFGDEFSIKDLTKTIKDQIDNIFNQIQNDLFTKFCNMLQELVKNKFNFDIYNDGKDLSNQRQLINNYFNTIKDYHENNNLDITLTKLEEDIRQYNKLTEKYKKQTNTIKKINNIIKDVPFAKLNNLIKYEELVNFLFNLIDNSRPSKLKSIKNTGITFIDNILLGNKNEDIENYNKKINELNKTIDILKKEKNKKKDFNGVLKVNSSNFFIISNENMKEKIELLTKNLNKLKDENKRLSDNLEKFKNKVNSFQVKKCSEILIEGIINDSSKKDKEILINTDGKSNEEKEKKIVIENKDNNLNHASINNLSHASINNLSHASINNLSHASINENSGVKEGGDSSLEKTINLFDDEDDELYSSK